jgi:hypothetical protein
MDAAGCCDSFENFYQIVRCHTQEHSKLHVHKYVLNLCLCITTGYLMTLSTREVGLAGVTVTTRWALMKASFTIMQRYSYENIRENNVTSLKREIIMPDFQTENLRNINQTYRQW